MKYLKLYSEQSELRNESVRDFLKPKSKEEILKHLGGRKDVVFKPTDKLLKMAYFIGTYETSYKNLVKIFGEPNSDGDYYKISTEWNLEDDKGNLVNISDYKMTNLYDLDYPSVEDFREEPSYEWRVFSNNKEILKDLKTFIFLKESSLNESVRDFLKPKSDEELDKSIKNLNQYEKDRMLDNAIQVGLDLRLIKLLLKNGANIAYVKHSPYHWWWKRGHHKERKELIDKYSKVDESIRDFLKPKSEQEILKNITNLSTDEILQKSIKYNILFGFKYLIDNNLIKGDDKYVVEKYIMGLHKNEPLRDFEKWFLEKLTNLKVIKSKRYDNILIYKKDGIPLFNYNVFNHSFLYSDDIKLYLCKTSIYSTKFNIEEELIDVFIKSMAEEHLNIKIDEITNPIYAIITR